MKISIIVLNWKRFEETRDCISSLQSLKVTKDAEVSIIVVDNNSGDGSAEKLRKLKKSTFPVEVIANTHNYGFAGGNNVGMKYAMNNLADYIMVLNNDTRVHPELLQELLNVFSSKDVGVASPKIYFEKGYEYHKDRYTKAEHGKVIWYAGGDIDWNNIYGSNRGVDEIDEGQYDEVRELDFATGACFLISRKAVTKAGFFDERYFMYLEDVEYSQRIQKKGLKILFAPKAKLWHKVAQSSAIGSGLNDYFLSRNRLFFAKRYASERARFALFRESLKFMLLGREWQRKGVIDYYKNNMGKGSWQN